MQKGIFAVLVLIAFLLGANLFRGNDAQAAKVYKYEVVKVGMNEVQDKLNEASQKGYEYVGTYSGSHALIFRK